MPSSVLSPAVPLITAAGAAEPTTNNAKLIEAHSTASLLTLTASLVYATNTSYPTAAAKKTISDACSP